MSVPHFVPVHLVYVRTFDRANGNINLDMETCTKFHDKNIQLKEKLNKQKKNQPVGGTTGKVRESPKSV